MNFYTFDLDPQQETFVKAILSADNTVVFCNAAAGTGKTTLAMGAANMLVKGKKLATTTASSTSFLPTVRRSRATCPVVRLRSPRSTSSLHIRP